MKKTQSRNKEGVKEKESERGEKGAKRQTRCVFCLDLNGAERKGVGVRRRACEEEKERGKASGSKWIFFFRGEDCNETKAFIAKCLYVGRGGCAVQYVITYQQNHTHYTNCYNGPGGWGLKRG